MPRIGRRRRKLGLAQDMLATETLSSVTEDEEVVERVVEISESISTTTQSQTKYVLSVSTIRLRRHSERGNMFLVMKEKFIVSLKK